MNIQHSRKGYMLRFVTLLTVLLYASLSFGQQTGVFQTIKLLPTTLPATCNVGDLRTNTATNTPNFCSAANTWTSAGGGSTAASTIATTQNNTGSSFYPLFVPSSTNGQQVTSLSTGFSINPSTDVVTATTFSGALSGNATSATTATSATSATNSTNVSTTNTNTNTTYYPTFVSSLTNGNQLERLTSGFSINPSTDVVTATTFSGALSGNATTATTATSATSATNSTNSTNVGTINNNTSATFYPLFASSLTNSNQAPNLTSGFSVNPSTDVVTATTFSGALSGNATSATTATTATNATNATNATTATNATNVASTNNNTSATFYPTFVSSLTNGNQAENITSGFSINPSTDVVTATTFSGALSGNATSATTATTATNATNVSTTNTNSNSSFFPTFVSSTTNGNQLERVTTGFSVNPSTDVVTATTFSGALSGNATSATTATSATSATNTTNVGTTNNNSNSSFFPLFVSSSANGNQASNLTTGFSVNPSTDVVTATTFSGALSGNATSSTTATNATNVATTATTTSAGFFPLMVSSSANSNQAASLMTGFRFNPGTDVLSAGGYITGYTTTATAATTTTLTNTSTQQQFFTGGTTQTLKLPVTSTLNLGQTYVVVNNSSGTVTVQSSGANTIQAMAGSTFATFTVILTSGTTASSWAVEYTPPAGTPTFSGLTQWGAIYANTTTTVASTATGTAGDVLVSNGSAAPSYLGAVAASYYASASGATSTTQTINFDTKVYDTNAAVTAAAAGTGTWKFTAPVTGYYHVGGWLGFFTQHYFAIYKNGTIFANIGTTDPNAFSEGFSYDIQLNVGDYIDIRSDSANNYVGGTVTAQGAACQIVIHLIK